MKSTAFAASAKTYYRLTKPGIIRGNALTAAAAFVLGSKNSFQPVLFLAMLVGISLVVASACVFNNYIDRDIDRLMARTKQRALVLGTVPPRHALFYGALLGLLGTAVLAVWTNFLAAGLAVLGFIFYVVVYGYAKRKTVHGTVVGSISGAIPPVVGYCAASGRFDAAAIILFIILVCWQMPHFYAIAIYRKADYAAAKIPVLPIVHGNRAAKIQMLAYIVAFIFACTALALYGYAGQIYTFMMALCGGVWLALSFRGFKAKNDEVWARMMFRFSLIAILIFSIMISLSEVLP